MRYKVTISETLERTVEVYATNDKDAINKVRKLYNKCSIVLTADDFDNVKFIIEK